MYERSQLNTLIRPHLENGARFTVFDANNQELCTFGGQGPEGAGDLSWTSHSAETVRGALQRLGLIKMFAEYYPLLAVTDPDAGTRVEDQHRPEFADWFNKRAWKSPVLPDTNILVNRTLNSVIMPPFIHNGILDANFTIVIPRFAILELENLANSKRTNKGRFLQAFDEVRRLRELGASLTSPLAPEELSSFQTVSGKALVDIFLREEVRRTINQYPGNTIGIFLTGDMVSALAGNSEGLATIYIAPADPSATTQRLRGVHDVRETLIEIAIDQSKILVEWADNTKTQFEGVWSGKSWSDYRNRSVMVTFPASN